MLVPPHSDTNLPLHTDLPGQIEAGPLREAGLARVWGQSGPSLRMRGGPWLQPASVLRVGDDCVEYRLRHLLL